MKVAIDCQTALGNKVGIGIAVSSLVEELKKLPVEVIPIYPETTTDLNTPERVQWDQWSFPRKARQAHADIIHQPGLSCPIFTKIPSITTVYHIFPAALQKLPEFALSKGAHYYFNKLLPFAARFSTRCITTSHYMKKKLINDWGISEKKIDVVYIAPSPYYHASKKSSSDFLKKNLGINSDYLLYVGSLHRYKNIELLIEILDESKRCVQKDLKLVVCGKDAAHAVNLKKIISEKGLENSVIFTGYTPENVVQDLYNNAFAFLMPSLYEGFCLPALEAMNCETPVLCSNTSCLPEIIGPGAILLDPRKPAPWVEAIKGLKDKTSFYNKMVAAGLKNTQRFSWEKCAKETLGVYLKTHQNLAKS